MTALTFDTYEAIKRLTDSGLDERQAHAVTETIKTAQDAHLEDLATKGDLALLRSGLEVKLAETEVRILKWVAMMLVAQAGVIAALVKLL